MSPNWSCLWFTFQGHNSILKNRHCESVTRRGTTHPMRKAKRHKEFMWKTPQCHLLSHLRQKSGLAVRKLEICEPTDLQCHPSTHTQDISQKCSKVSKMFPTWKGHVQRNGWTGFRFHLPMHFVLLTKPSPPLSVPRHRKGRHIQMRPVFTVSSVIGALCEGRWASWGLVCRERHGARPLDDDDNDDGWEHRKGNWGRWGDWAQRHPSHSKPATYAKLTNRGKKKSTSRKYSKCCCKHNLWITQAVWNSTVK